MTHPSRESASLVYAGAPVAIATPGAAALQRARDYLALTKPHIISLLLVTTLAPMIVAAGGWPDGYTVLWTMLGGYLMAGSANATNMYIDRDIDGRMERTARRPIPSGRVAPGHALAFAGLLAVAALHVLAAEVNHLAALFAVSGWAWYVGVYTLWLKRSSPHACVVGGVAGAFPALIGWAAVTGGVSVTALICFAIVFVWTPPHFWALALLKQRDYGKVGIPMAPAAWGERRTLRQMSVYTVALIPLTLAPVALGELGLLYGASALLLGGWFLGHVLRVGRAADLRTAARAAYGASLLYLALLFFAMALDRLV